MMIERKKMRKLGGRRGRKRRIDHGMDMSSVKAVSMKETSNCERNERARVNFSETICFSFLKREARLVEWGDSQIFDFILGAKLNVTCEIFSYSVTTFESLRILARLAAEKYGNRSIFICVDNTVPSGFHDPHIRARRRPPQNSIGRHSRVG